MSFPEWQDSEGEYILDVGLGRGIIEEKSRLYFPRIEDRSGNVIARFEPGFDNFETADAFVQANLIQLDQVSVDDQAFREKLAHSIDRCLPLFSEPSRIFHRLRLEAIRRWVLRQSSDMNAAHIPKNDWAYYRFDWQQRDRQYICETLHGKVTIVESPPLKADFQLGATDEYQIQIEDMTGGALKGHFNPAFDFLDAEARVRRILSDLEWPFVDEVYLIYLLFTLEIGEKLLPLEADPMDYVRLRYLQLWLGESLP